VTPITSQTVTCIIGTGKAIGITSFVCFFNYRSGYQSFKKTVNPLFNLTKYL